MEDFFRELAVDAPRWNFIWMHDERQQGKILAGLWMTVKLSVLYRILSVIIGLVGAWMQGSRLAIVRASLRAIVQGYIQCFRNTPPMVQLLFFYFALWQFTPFVTGPDGWTVQAIISNVSWAFISLNFFAGAFNVEIFRAGIEAVPESTVEAAESLGFSRLQIYLYIVLPLAIRACLPALNNNLVNLVKTTTQAYAIAEPELLYHSVSIWNDFPSAQFPTMTFVFFACIFLVAILVFGVHRWERAMKIPGYGT